MMQKKAKIAKVVNDLCKAVTEQVGTFIQAVAKIDDEEPDIDPYVLQTSTGTGTSCCAPKGKRRVSPIQEEDEFVETRLFIFGARRDVPVPVDGCCM